MSVTGTLGLQPIGFTWLKFWSVIVNPPAVLALAIAPIGTSELLTFPLITNCQVLPLFVVVAASVTVGVPATPAITSGHSFMDEKITGSENAIMTVSRPLLSLSDFSRIDTLSRVGRMPSEILIVSALVVPLSVT